jgi:hypothetical protein
MRVGCPGFIRKEGKPMNESDSEIEVLEALIGKAMVDPIFREYLLEHPKKAAESVGYTISEAQANRIKQMNKKAVDVFVASFQAGTGFGAAAERPLW